MSITKIGIFDSGIGGLALLKELFGNLRGADFYYIADQEFCPYGDKTPSEIIARSQKMTGILLAKKVDLIVLACNTATAVAIGALREQHSIPFVGIEPYLNIINQKEKLPSRANVGALMTPRTLGASKFQLLMKEKDPEGKITYYPLGKLAGLIEKNFKNLADFNFINKVREELSQIKTDHTHIILGCTHYTLIAQEIARFLEVETVSPCQNVARRVLDLIALEKEVVPSGSFHFYSTPRNEWESLPRSLSFSQISTNS